MTVPGAKPCCSPRLACESRSGSESHEHGRLAHVVTGPDEHARLSAVVGELLDGTGRMGRREEPPRDESGLRARSSNQRFHSQISRLLRQSSAGAEPPPDGLLSPSTLSPIWRRGCQGVGVDGHGLVGVAVVGVVAAGGAVRASAGSRRFGHAHIRGLGSPRPWFVARPLSKVERGRSGAGAQATNRGLVCASRGRLGPPRQPQRVW